MLAFQSRRKGTFLELSFTLHLSQNVPSSNLSHLVDFQVAFLRVDGPENKHRQHTCLKHQPRLISAFRNHQNDGNCKMRFRDFLGKRCNHKETTETSGTKYPSWWHFGLNMLKYFLPTCYSLPCSPDESLDLCSRVWIFWMAQHLNSQHVRGQCRAESQQANLQLYDTVWIYIYICHAVRSLVLAVPTAGINWQIGPCYRRNEWVGGTSALSNIKLMGRTIGASTALCMTAAKHCQVSLLFCIFAFKLKFKFQTEQAQIPKKNLSPLD